MSSTKKLRKTKPVANPIGSQSRSSVFAFAKTLNKTSILACMISHRMVVPRLLSLSSPELIEAIGVYVEEKKRGLTWGKIYNELIKADKMEEDSVCEWKAMILYKSAHDASSLLTLGFPLLAKWKLFVKWGPLYKKHIDTFERDTTAPCRTYLLNENIRITGAARYIDHKHSLKDKSYNIDLDDDTIIMKMKISPDALITTDANTELFRTLNIKAVSNRSTVLPPLLVDCVMKYTRALLLDDCSHNKD